MGQINTNNYPAVDSLLDDDLLIVENATHGTGTTTPKQLRENAIGTDPLQTTAQTVTEAINEIFEMAGAPYGLELGKMTSFTSGTITTDIDLHREPAEGDRILFYHNSAVASPSNLTTYNDGVAVTKSIMDFSMTHPIGLTLMEFGLLGWTTVQDIAAGGYTAGTGISINGTTISNSAPQLGDDIAYSKIETVTSGALGYFNADADLLVMDFRTDAAPYNGGYTLRLQSSGASFKYAVLKDKAGNSYADAIPSGSLVLCKSNVSGTGSEADPVIVTVLEIGNTTMANDVEILKDAIITEKTASGNPITVTDALPYAALSLSADIEPIQDLHGYDKPWVGGSGKNKLPMTVDRIKAANTDGSWSGNVYTINGGTFTILTDSADNVTGIKINGTFSEQPIFRLGYMDFYANTAYTLNGAVPNTSNFRLAISTKGSDYGDGYTYIPTADDLQRTVIVYCDNNPTANNLVFKPMIRTSGDATFAPYSNICPISGHTSVTITRTDAESQTADFTIQLGTTVYGADINWDTGVMTVTHVIKDLGDLEWAKDGDNRYYYRFAADENMKTWTGDNVGTQISSIYEAISNTQYSQRYKGGINITLSSSHPSFMIYDPTYNDTAANFGTYVDGQTICYELATPIELTLTPTEVQMLKGYNQISSDGGGDITLIYKADRLAAIEAALAAL